jgi:hypothetical protein
VKTREKIVIGKYPEGVQFVNAARVVEGIGNYLLGSDGRF